VTSHRAAVYDGVAHSWAGGPSRVYDRLADAIVASYPGLLADEHVLDIGAGTGAISRAVIRSGGRCTAVDAADDMVEHMRAHGLDAVVGDLLALPFDNDSFDGAIAAFSVSHVEDPVRALVEAARVVRSGGVVMVGSFAARPANQSKDVVDSCAQRFGYVRPLWYEHLKGELEPMTNTPERLRDCADRAGLADIVIVERMVDTGVVTADDIVASRIGMAHLAPFVNSLTDSQRREFVAGAIAAVAHDPQPLRPDVLIMSSRVRA
jgi:ubiquinone/menaquinone biosynthesis C-methylase UbiE